MNNVFVDSSVLFAGVVSPTGHARDMLTYGQNRALHLTCSTQVLTEVERNIQRKFPKSIEAYSAFTHPDVLTIVDASDSLIQECAQLIHPKDASIVAAAASSKSDWLATFDRRHLLRMRTQITEHFGVSVAEPRDILTTLGLSPAT